MSNMACNLSGKCGCWNCKARSLIERNILPRLGEKGRDLVQQLWNRMWIAENHYDILRGKARNGMPIRFGDITYVAKDSPRPRRRGRKGIKRVSIPNFDGRRV